MRAYFYNYNGREEAQAIAEKIKNYWKARGAEVNLSIDTITGGDYFRHQTFWIIRSDMKNGMPTGSNIVFDPDTMKMNPKMIRASILSVLKKSKDGLTVSSIAKRANLRTYIVQHVISGFKTLGIVESVKPRKLKGGKEDFIWRLARKIPEPAWKHI